MNLSTTRILSHPTADATIFVIEIESKTVVEIAGGLSDVYEVAACAKTKTFAAIGDWGVGLWKLGSKERQQRIRTTNTPTTQTIRISPTGGELAFRSGNLEVQIWSLGDDKPNLVATEKILDEPWGIAFSRDGDRLAICDRVGVLHLRSFHDSPDNESMPAPPPIRWQAHEGRVNAIAFSPSGSELASIGKDGKLKIWEPAHTKSAATLASRFYIHGYRGGLSFSKASPILAAGSEQGIQLWDVATKSLRRTIDGAGVRRDLVAISSDQQYVVAGQKNDAFVELWRLDDPISSPAWRLDGQQCDQLILSPNDQMLAVVDYFNDEVVLFDTASGNKLKTLPARQCWTAAFSPDGAFLAVTVQDDIHVWSCADWKVVHELQGHHSTTTTVVYSPDGQWIASGGKDRTIRLWNAASGRETHRMLGHQDIVTDLAFSPVGKSLVSVSADGSVKAWHVATGESLCDLWSNPANPPYSVAFSADGNRIAIRLDGGQIVLLDVLAEDVPAPVAK